MHFCISDGRASSNTGVYANLLGLSGEAVVADPGASAKGDLGPEVLGSASLSVTTVSTTLRAEGCFLLPVCPNQVIS